ncbi:MAG: glycosyltransferase family 2 protein [Candidatus Andersenbacteria bacterium]
MLTINRIGGAVLRRLSLRLPESMPAVVRAGHHERVTLPTLKPLTNWPTVDIVTVFYNGARHVTRYLEAIRALDYPPDRLHLFLLDNGSTDTTLALLRAQTAGLTVTLVAVGTNKGFTGGCNVALRACQADYILLLNPDTRIAPEALKTLVMRAEQERGIGIVEAAQQPVEHPKWFDQQTQETPWCSGAVSLLRRRALLRTGVFDERLFMYCEDVDLSWRMWAKGYRCVYEPRAKVWHEQGVKSAKGGEREYYLAFRNGLMLRFVYGGLREYLRYGGKMLRLVFLQSDHSLTGKRLLLRALVAHLRNLPHLIRRRREQAAVPGHRWIRFVGWDYHIRRW